MVVVSILSTTEVWSQEEEYVRLEYIKLPTNAWNEYWTQIQDVWKPLYQEMKDNGELSDWKLFWVRFPAGQNIPYDAVNVTFHKGANDMANTAISDYYRSSRATAGLSLSKFEEPVLNVVNKVKVETYKVVDKVIGNYELDSLALTNQNYQIDFMDVARGNEAAYIKMEKEVFKPMHQVVINDQRMKNWILCERVSQDENAILKRFIIFNQWSSWANYQNGGGMSDFQKVDPDIDQDTMNEIFNEMGKTRQMTKSEMWGIWDEL